MESSGIIFAALDCDLDAVEAWNHWYDLEHIPPNVVLGGIMFGHRYVSPPAFHEQREGRPGTHWTTGRASFLTIYTLTGDPLDAFAEMSTVRDRLVAADRMFPDEKKIVREGDVLDLAWVVADPALRADDRDVPFISHTGVIIIQHDGSGSTSDWYRTTFAPAAVALDGVHAVCSYASINRPGLSIEVILVEGDVLDAQRRLAASAPQPDDPIVVGAFDLIVPLRYPWADDFARSTTLPRTVAD